MADDPTTALAVAPPRTRTLKRERSKAKQIIEQAKKLQKGERQCKAIRKTGKRCTKFAIKGGTVCPTHGGSAPQVKAKAQKRLLAMVEPSLIRLNALVQQEEHLPTALGAIRTVLERAGTPNSIGPLAKESGDKDKRPIINIGIKVGGIERPVVSVGMQLPAGETASDDDVVDGEFVGSDDESDE